MFYDISLPVAKKGHKTVTIGISAPPSLKKEFDELAENLDRTSSWLGLKFLLRGGQRFNQDGQFEEPKDGGGPGDTGLTSDNNQPTARTAPSVQVGKPRREGKEK